MTEDHELEVTPPSPKDRFGDTAKRITELEQAMSKTEITLAFTFRELEQARRDWLEAELRDRHYSVCSDIGHEERIYKLKAEAEQAGLKPDIKPEDMGLFSEEDVTIVFTSEPKTLVIGATGKRSFPTILPVCHKHREEMSDVTEITRDTDGKYTLDGDDVTEDVRESLNKTPIVEAVYNYLGIPIFPRPYFNVQNRLKGSIDTKIYSRSFDPSTNTWSQLRSKL